MCCNVFTINIKLFKCKRFKDERCAYKNEWVQNEDLRPKTQKRRARQNRFEIT